MINLEIRVKIPFLWGKTAFVKKNWQEINLIVGPNGSGKSLLAEGIAKQFVEKGYQVTVLKSDRINQDALFELIQNQEHIKKKVEEVLASMFGKSIRFEMQQDGSYAPIVTNKARGDEYNLKEGECHGLKEILTLLVSLYDINTKVLILDEPELHLHPQFQQFFMNELRKVSQENPERIFFLITHSPYFIDLRYAQDLLGVIVCHINHVPTSIDVLSEEDEALLKRFLPRFNTYHKQFFFSDNQIFVEGYTDQKIFSHLLTCVDNQGGLAGTGIIDVGGKDELGVFYKVCSLLGTNARIITDLDALFAGKLRDVVCDGERISEWLEAQEDKQAPFYKSIFTKRELEIPVTLERLIHKLENMIVNIGQYIYSINGPIDKEIDLYIEKITNLYDKYDKPEGLDLYKTVVLIGIINLSDKLKDLLPIPLATTVPLIENLTNYILACIEKERVYILHKGCIEHYYIQSDNKYMPISGKDKLFHSEIEYMLSVQDRDLKKDYRDLIAILNKACVRDFL